VTSSIKATLAKHPTFEADCGRFLSSQLQQAQAAQSKAQDVAAPSVVPVLVLMFVYTHPETGAFTRELVLLGEPVMTRRLHEYLTTTAECQEKLGLVLIQQQTTDNAVTGKQTSFYYTQTNVKASRKAVAPLLAAQQQTQPQK
jgi:hypothetical protein